MIKVLAGTKAAWSDYRYWQSRDKKILRRINRLLAEIKKNPFEGMGRPEQLKEGLSGFWSRRIDESNHLVYAVDDYLLSLPLMVNEFAGRALKTHR